MSIPASRNVTVENRRAVLAKALRRAADQESSGPLSFAQQRLWFLDQLQPGTALYNVASLLKIVGVLDRSALENSLDSVIARHEVLRTRFASSEEGPLQVVHHPAGFKLAYVDLTAEPEPEREATAAAHVRQELARAFNLALETPFRATLLRLQPDVHWLLLNVHHIAADEWSFRILHHELFAYYDGFARGQLVTLPELQLQYRDFAAWQRANLQGPTLEQHLQYWKQQLSGISGMTQLPGDHPAPAVPSFSGRTASRTVGPDTLTGLQRLADGQHATLFMVLLAAFKALVHRYTLQEDIVVGSPIAGRNRAEVEGLIGFFVNTLPLRTSVKGDDSFCDLLARVRETTLDAYSHQDLPFEKIVEALQPERSLSHLAFTKLMFVLQSERQEIVQLHGLKVEFLDVETETAKFDVTVTCQQVAGSLRLRCEFSNDVFEPGTIARLLEHYEGLLTDIVRNPGARIADLALLGQEESVRILETWNQTTYPYPREKTIHALFHEQAQRTPDALAVTFGAQRLTYAELETRANQLGQALRSFGVQPEDRVALCVQRSADMVVGMLGILKSGAAYVPIDPNYPKDRLEFMLEDSGVRILLTQQSLLSTFISEKVKVICLDADWELIAPAGRVPPPETAQADSLAYVMYTSGSTGKPKGVAVPHRAVNRLVINANYISPDSWERVGQLANISFDALTFEIWGALLNGGRVVGITQDVALSPKDFARELQESGITSIFITSALFSGVVAEIPDAFSSLKTVIAGGEALDPKFVRAVLHAGPPRELVNGYGPTENTTFTACHLIQNLSANARSVPIGRPIANTRVFILDRYGNPVPIGAPGELHAAGDGLARGYWNRPELDQERFITRQLRANSVPERLYRTGDLARWLPDGTIEFLGRIDSQVKIRGFRIELGEIESVLNHHPDVRESAITVAGSTPTNRRLIAYFVPEGEPGPNASALRNYLAEKLPEYMVPAVFIQLPALPLTPNGKVDRRALPAPDQTRPDLEKKYVAPVDRVEKQLTAIWEQVLGVHPIGIEDKFFDLGGHSLLAVKVNAHIQKTFGKKLRLATIFQAPTIRQLAAILRDEIGEPVSSSTSLVEIHTSGTRPPLFLVHGAGGGMFWGYVNLARHIDQTVYGFKSRGLDGLPELGSIEELAAQYIGDLRTVCPQGPYYLGGYCFGGVLAFEMARQLEAAGDEIAMLALLNCAPPNSRYTRIPWTPRWFLRLFKNLIYWGGYFKSWNPSQRRDFFRWKWSVFKNKVRSLTGGQAADLSQVDVRNVVDLSSYTPEQQKVWEAHINALIKYHPKPYGGKVHLYRSPGHPLWCSFEPDYGWGEYAGKGVKVTIVPGAHEKILEEPLVQTLASALAENIGTAMDAGRVSPQGESAQKTSPSPEAAIVTSNIDMKCAIDTDCVAYWKTKLADAPGALDLPADRPRVSHAPKERAQLRFELDPQHVAKMQALAKQLKAEPEVAFLSVFHALLFRYSGNREIILGRLSGNSRVRSTAPSALVTPVLPLRLNADGDPTFSEFVARNAVVLSEASRYSHISLSRLLQELNVPAEASQAPVFQVTFRFLQGEDTTKQTASDTGVEVENQVRAADVACEFVSCGGHVQGCLDYSTALFDPDRMERMASHYAVMLEAAASNPACRVADLPLLPVAEEEQVVRTWNRVVLPYPRQQTITGLFTDQVLRTPDAVAVISGQTRLSYRELHARATCVANCLRNMGVGEGSLVGICLERSWEMLAAILGTLQTGAAYVPLDPAYPRDRLEFIIRDAQAAFIVTQQSLRERLPNTHSKLICIEEIDWLQAVAAPAAKRTPNAGAIAYVIYTSGSTGVPKGVELTHANAVAFITWAQSVFSQDELAGVLASTSVCFDLSIFEMFVPLSVGGKVILARNALALPELNAASEVTLINTVPSAIAELLRVRGVPSSVRVVNLAGEPLSTAIVDQLYSETRVAKVYDLYGPTETTTYSTFALRRPGETPTIGRPLANEQVYLLDSKQRPVPIGIPGEVYIGGVGVARGYRNRPDLTAERFLPNPFLPGQRMYRTGDLARWRKDGVLDYLGRLDHQVKIRGYRIELAEIEARLKRHPEVKDAVVIAWDYQPGDKRLVAYLAVSSPSVRTESVRQALKDELPDYMIPAVFVVLPALPRTPNGKLDRKALPPPGDARNVSHSLVPPRNSTEERLIAIFKEVLRVPEIGVRDSFFELGGHSLLAIRVISRVRETFKVELPLFTLFDASTPESLASIITSNGALAANTVAFPLEPVPRDGRLPVSFVQQRLWFLDQLRPGSDAYNVPAALRLKGKLDLGALDRAFKAVVLRHEALRTRFVNQEGALTQEIMPAEFVGSISVESFSPPPSEDAVQEWLRAQAQKPFDLCAGPLVRASLLVCGPEEHLLVVVMHHTVSDGWSVAVFFQDLQAFYAASVSHAPSTDLPALPVHYGDYAAWQHRYLSADFLEAELAFWKKTLAGAPGTVELPKDRNQNLSNWDKVGREHLLLGQEVQAAIQRYVQAQNVTPFILLMGALAVLLRKWAGQKDLVLGTVVAGRNRREIENVIGCFMNFLPVRVKVSGRKTSQEFFADVRQGVIEAQNHQECPFEKMVEAINPERKHDQNPLYNVALLVQNFPAELFRAPGLESSVMPVPLSSPLLDLRFEVEDTPKGLKVVCEYRTSLFQPATIEALLAGFKDTLWQLVSRPGQLLQEIPLHPRLIEQSRLASQEAHRQSIRIAANFTAEPLEEPLRFWMNDLAIPAEIEFAPYNQVFQQLLDPGSLLSTNPGGVNAVFIRIQDWGNLQEGDRGRARIESNAAEFVSALKAAVSRTSAPCLVIICPPSPAFAEEPGNSELLVRVEGRLQSELEAVPGACFIGTRRLADAYPISDYADPAADALGHVPYTGLFWTALATMVARSFHALKRPGYKVIALDCDNTLWSGVCGEDGPAGISVDAPRCALQRFMRAQQDAGMLICLCSKNNPEDVEKVFTKHADMPLRWQDITASRLNWRPKSENLKALARELNLGLDSFIFVDDNPVECAEVEANCPEVLTLLLPESESIPEFLRNCWAFDHFKLTAEDRKRARMYRENQARERLRAEAPSLAEFLAGLDLQVRIEEMGPDDSSRVAQLTQRTNQFNCTTRRRTEAEIQKLAPDNSILTVRVSDRFGDYGLVGVVVYRKVEQSLDVETFLLSCRVLGRGVEHRVLSHLGQLAARFQARWVDVHFTASAKNRPAADFLESVGAGFKQPQNGGFLFRFPARYAAEAAFTPQVAPVISPQPEKLEKVPATEPTFSIPTRFAKCRQIALDTADLPALHARLTGVRRSNSPSVANYVPPRTELERGLCQIWQNILQLERVGVHDNFFDIGGHSLLAVRLFAEIERLTGQKLPLVTLFQAGTVEALARLLSHNNAGGSRSLLVPIQPNGTRTPLFLIHGAGGDVLWGYANLAAHLGPDQPIYGIKSRGQAGLDEFESLEEMARCYVSEVRLFQPTGPYCLGGYCFGGNVAYEMARQLQADGQTVLFLSLLDSAPSNAGYERVPWWHPAFPFRFVRNVSYWIGDFGRLKSSDKRRFVSRKARALIRKLQQLGGRHAPTLVDLEDVIDTGHFPDQELKLWQAHLEALVRHVDKPYSGPVTLLRTRGQPLFCSLEPDFCWSKLAPALSVRRIPGSHEEIFVEPHVQTLARELRLCLAEAEGEGKPALPASAAADPTTL